MKVWQRYLRNFCIFFACSFAVTAAVYLLLSLLYSEELRPIILGTSFRMFLYHGDHPFLYISTVCLCYALLATFLAAPVARGGARATLWAWGIVLLSPILASPLGGMLWHYHDMMANRIPTYGIDKLLSGIGEGYRAGWFIILLGFPYNAICAIIGGIGTLWVAKKLEPSAPTASHSARIHIMPLTLCYVCLLGAGTLVGIYSLHTVSVQAAHIKAVMTKGDAASVESFISKHKLDVTEKIPAVHSGYGTTALSMAMHNADKAVYPLVLGHATSPTAAQPAKVFAILGSTMQERNLAEALRIAKACQAFPPHVQKQGFGEQRNKLHDLFQTPLPDAAQRAALLQLFIEGGAFEVDYIQLWLGSITESMGNTDFYPPLIKAGIIKAEDMDGLLAAAARRNPSPAMTSFFLAMGAQPNALGSQSFFEDSPQDTPILALSAVYNQNPTIMQLLLDAGANPNATDTHGNRVLDLLDAQLTIKQDESKRDILLQKRAILLNADAHTKNCNCPPKD